MMEFDEIIVKENPGLCRCCLSEGCYKELATEYNWMNETEIYADMLLECFDIGISQHNDGPNGPSRLICEVCITRLRDACNFKKQVVESEKKFVDMVGRGDFNNKVLIYQPSQIKAEEALEEMQDETEVEYLEEELELNDVSEEAVKEESVPPPRARRGRPRKTARPDDKQKTSKTTAKDLKTKTVEATPSQTENQKKLRELLSSILEYSTALPFRMCRGKYKCFFCNKNHNTVQDLTLHTNNAHGSMYFTKHETYVKVDITDLQCKLCSTTIENVPDLLAHLREHHNKTVNTDAAEYIIAFKLNDNSFKCLICCEEFDFFPTLLVHTFRKHLRGRYVCDICDINFASHSSLQRHTDSKHIKCSYKCEQCNKVFQASHRRDSHVKRIHDINKRKCKICSIVLNSVYQRDTHLAKVHDVWTSQFKCNECPKIYRYKHQLVDHIKRTHLKQKDISCDLCGERFYDNRLLRLHKVRHSGEKPFACGICSRKFPRKRALDMHSKIHSKNKFACKECGKAFVQRKSLVLHLKVHRDNNKS